METVVIPLSAVARSKTACIREIQDYRMISKPRRWSAVGRMLFSYRIYVATIAEPNVWGRSR